MGGAGRAKVVRGAANRVARVVDVAAEPVRAPGRREELHRALRSGDARVAQPAEVGLDVVDGGEHVPIDPEAALGRGVLAEQRLGRQRRADAEGGERARLRQSGELPAGSSVAEHGCGDGRRQPRRDRPCERLVAGEPEHELLLRERRAGDRGRWRRRGEVAGRAPATDGVVERPLRRDDAPRERGGVAAARSRRRATRRHESREPDPPRPRPVDESARNRHEGHLAEPLTAP
jgi:hypothetical protein